MDRKELILYLIEKRKGFIDDLKENPTVDMKLFEEFHLIWYVRYGTSIRGESTWCITDLGIKQKDFYRDPILEEKVFNRIYNSIPLP